MLASISRTSTSSSLPTDAPVARLRSESVRTPPPVPDLATATRLGHRLEALAVPRSAPLAGALAAPIQRVLSTNRLGQVPPALTEHLTQQIQEFNDHLGTQPEIGQEQQHRDRQFQLLHGIDERINTHLRDNPEMADEHRAALFSVLRDTEDHHVGATRQAVAAHDPLWLPESVGAQDAQHARERWGSILGEQGNLRIEGNDDFRAETHSGIAKLLQGAHGRGLLDDVDAPQVDAQKRITIRRDQTSTAAPNSMADAIQHGAHPSPGTGSTVKIAARGAEPASMDAYSSGTSGEAIFSPRFMTLGHELGHARHSLAGTTRDVMWSNDPHDAVQDPIEKALWTDPEEHRNITGEENPLRAEHNMPQRQYHTTRGAGRSTRNRMELTHRLDQLMDTIPNEHADALGPALGEIHGDITNTDLSNPEAAQALHGRIHQAEQAMPGRIRWERMKAFGKKALPYVAVGAGLMGAGYLGKKRGWF